MLIDPTSGRVTLPNGSVVGPQLTREAFRSTPLGSIPRDWYSVGSVDGHELLAGLLFYDQELLRLCLAVNLYPQDELKDWSHYSLQIEAETKRLHERMLVRLLGKPTSHLDSHRGSESDELAVLNRAVWWNYHWGTIGSHHDSKGGGTFIAIKYGDREEQANAAYRKLKR